MITARAGAVDRRLWFDIGLAGLVPAVQWALLIFTGALQALTAADAVSIFVVLVQGVALAARRSRSWLSLCVLRGGLAVGELPAGTRPNGWSTFPQCRAGTGGRGRGEGDRVDRAISDASFLRI